MNHHIEDDNVKFFRKFLKSMHIQNQRYGNEILLDDGFNFICHTRNNIFNIEMISPNNELLKTFNFEFNYSIEGFSRFKVTQLLNFYNTLLYHRNYDNYNIT